MAITDPDIVELQHQIEASTFGPSTKMSMANTLAFAAKCNGGPTLSCHSEIYFTRWAK